MATRAGGIAGRNTQGGRAPRVIWVDNFDEARGRNRLIEANPSSPVYPELRSLLLETLGPEPLLRSALADIDGIEDASIYGSWADPANRSPADIDLMAVGDPDLGAVYHAASSVEAEVGCPVNVTVRSPTEWADSDRGFELAVESGPRINLR